jgi:hypothetical protein
MKGRAKLLHPKSVKEVIATQKWREEYKKNAVGARQGIVESKGVTWS